MAHEIEQNSDGSYLAFFVKNSAWHKKGRILDLPPTIDEACSLAYPYSIIKLPLEARIDTEGTIAHLPVPSHCAIVRSDGKVLSAMGSGYEVVQPRESIEFLSPFVESGLVDIEAGGSLRDGKRMWILAKIKGGDADILPGDQVKAYLLGYTSFDGSLSNGKMLTNVRVVCANTLAQAVGETDNLTSWKLKHTKNIRVGLADIQRQIAMTLNQFNKDVECYRDLATRSCNDAQLKTYIDAVFEIDRKVDAEPISSRTENKLESIYEMTLRQPELEMVPAMRGTAWNAYNGITQYLQHEYGNSDDSRTDNMWFGKSAEVSRRALGLACVL